MIRHQKLLGLGEQDVASLKALRDQDLSGKVMTLQIRNLFKLSNGQTVVACDRPEDADQWLNCEIRIMSNTGELRQEIKFSNVASMMKQSANMNLVGFETPQPINLSIEEAQSGLWAIAA